MTAQPQRTKKTDAEIREVNVEEPKEQSLATANCYVVFRFPILLTRKL